MKTLCVLLICAVVVAVAQDALTSVVFQADFLVTNEIKFPDGSSITGQTVTGPQTDGHTQTSGQHTSADTGAADSGGDAGGRRSAPEFGLMRAVEAVRQKRSVAESEMTSKIQLEGHVHYDFYTRRMKIAVSSGSMTFGESKFDFGGFTSLFLWDLNKNFTWGGGQCECSDIQEELYTLFVPPYAVNHDQGSVQITVGDGAKTVTCTKYAATEGSFTLEFYVADKQLYRAVFRFKTDQIDSTSTYDMWNHDNDLGDTAKLWKPDSSCTCPEPPQVQTVKDNADYPKPDDVCSTSDSGCVCPDQAKLDFCKGVVNYPIQKSVFIKETDDFVSRAHQGTVDILDAPSDNCKTELKTFLCRFYFPKCNKDGTLAPVAPDWAKSCDANNAGKIGGIDAMSDYETALGRYGAAGRVAVGVLAVLCVVVALLF